MKKYNTLHDRLRRDGPCAVAFSGGTDSSFLLAAVNEALKGNVLAVTASGAIFKSSETEYACRTAELLGVSHVVVEVDPLSDERFAENSSTRCYHCKKIVFSALIDAVRKAGFMRLVHAVNLDDTSDYRPGILAAQELGVSAPLADAGFCKNDIRELSRRMGYPFWDRPSDACLASRIPYGTIISPTRLQQVAMAEDYLHELGFHVCRVRHFGETAKIEISRDRFNDIMNESTRMMVVQKIRELGFLFVTLDLEGYQTGRLNRML